MGESRVRGIDQFRVSLGRKRLALLGAQKISDTFSIGSRWVGQAGQYPSRIKLASSDAIVQHGSRLFAKRHPERLLQQGDFFIKPATRHFAQHRSREDRR
jgi:hypothetical protein